MRVVVIGGGPAGIMAAITAAQEKNDVYILEKNNELGKKLLITGKGRCNLTSSLHISEFIKNIPGNGKFMYSAFQNYTNEDIIKFMENHGVKLKEERGNRIFPVSDKSIDILNALKNELKRLSVKIKFNAKVKSIEIENGKVISVTYENEDKKERNIEADKIILATGGKTYSATGSTGDGYEIAKKLGHTVTNIRPSLVPLTCNKDSLFLCKQLQGLSLRNVGIELVDKENNKKIYDDFGEMIFTHFGVSGPTVLSSSAHLLRYKNIDDLLKKEKIVLKIDLKPALNIEKLDLRVQRDFESNKNKELKNSLNELLPQKLISPIIRLSKIDENKKVNSITKDERRNLVKLLKNLEITIFGFRPLDEGIITSGGVNIKEINPKTMESKKVRGLYFAGEILDVDAYTGGFNLQIAYSSGYIAGKKFN